MTDGRKKKRPGIEEQQQIISRAAVSLFLEEGTRAVSIAQICQVAGVSRPTFYRCFDDKAALLASLYESSVNLAVTEFIAETQQRGDAAVSLRVAFEKMYDAIFSAPERACLLFRESNDPSSPAFEIVYRAFEGIAEGLMTRWQLTADDTVNRTCFMAMMASHQWIVHQAIHQGLSDATVANAKQAGWELARRMAAPVSTG